jgi:hypothetical protein
VIINIRVPEMVTGKSVAQTIKIVVYTQREQTCTARQFMTRSVEMGLASAEGQSNSVLNKHQKV